jgi:catechol 2,3-dioxygenase-like lactoylglutathione lyase family enzyme
MLTGIHHLALTVTDVERSAAWYRELLGMVQVIGDDTDDVRYRVLAHPDSGMVIGLRQYPVAGSGDAFDEMRTGMDHVAIGVESADELAGWAARLDELGIAHSPVTETPIGTVIVFRDPDNIQLEFWLPAA